MTKNQAQNWRGEWVPAIPTPLYLALGRVRCFGGTQKHTHCKKTFWSTRRYREHYALVHILGLD